MENVGRCRMNLKLSAKGDAQFDVTAEYETPEQTAENLAKAIDLCRAVMAEKGLKEVGVEIK